MGYNKMEGMKYKLPKTLCKINIFELGSTD
jgi:hypothetical protein